MRIFVCTHEKCFMWTSNIQHVMIHFIMLHDNISSTHGKYDRNTWTIFDVTWNIFHVWNHLVFIMSHHLYHVTWRFSCQVMTTLWPWHDNYHVIEKRSLRHLKDHVNTIFFNNSRRIIMWTWKIYHVQQRNIFLIRNL